MNSQIKIQFKSFSDEQIDLEKQELCVDSEDQTNRRDSEASIQVVRGSGYSPSPQSTNTAPSGGGHINNSNYSSRRGSGNNNNDKNSLGGLTGDLRGPLSGQTNNTQQQPQNQPSQSRRGSNRSSLESYGSRRPSIQRNGAILSASGKRFEISFVRTEAEVGNICFYY